MDSRPSSNWSQFRLLCKALGPVGDEVLLQELTTSGLRQLVETARYHDVLPALALRVAELIGDDLSLENSVEEEMTRALRQNTMRNMKISAQALKLAKVLNKAGIDPVFLKGTAQLLVTNRNNLGFRKQVDIDFLVAPGQLELAAERLIDDGYGFYDFTGNAKVPVQLRDVQTAVEKSRSHHHLPELMKEGCPAIVELHRHFLPARWQPKKLLEPFLADALTHEINGARFRIPSPEFQIIHLVLGKFVHDGYMARQSFPVREACDYLHIQEAADRRLNFGLITQHCGNAEMLFAQLVTELMGQYSTEPLSASGGLSVAQRMRLMERRMNSAAVSNTLDIYARIQHLTHSLIHSPMKLRGYLARLDII